MGFSQKAATLTVSNLRPTYSYSRSLNFRAIYDSQGVPNQIYDCLLSYERKFGGTIVNPSLFKQYLDKFSNKLKSYNQVCLQHKILLVQIPFAVSEDEEFFIDNIYREGQKKLYDRISDKAEKAIDRLTYENILICTSGIAEYVVLYK